MNELLLLLDLLSLFLQLLFSLLLFSVGLWSSLAREDISELIQCEEFRLSYASSALNVFFSQRFIKHGVSEHFTHVIDGYYLAISTDSFEEELHKLGILHIIFFLNDLLVVKDVLWGEDSFFLTVTKVHSFTYTVKESW